MGDGIDPMAAAAQLESIRLTGKKEDAPNGEKTVWMYWESAEGTEMPPLVRRCLASAQRHSVVTLVDNESIGRYVSPVRGVERLAHIAQRADYYRALLLYHHGGMWLDADTIVCQSLEPLFGALQDSTASLAAAFEWTNSKRLGPRVDECSVQYLVARKRSPALGEWVAECERRIQQAGVSSLAWESLGNNALTAALNKTAALVSGEVIRLPEHLVYGTGWRDHMVYYSWGEREEKEYKLAERAAIVVLYGKFMYGLPRERSGSLMARLFELSGEQSRSASQLSRWGGEPPNPEILLDAAPSRPGTASNGWTERPGASPSRYVSAP